MHGVNMFRINVTYLLIFSPGWVYFNSRGLGFGVCPFLKYVSKFVLVGTKCSYYDALR